MTGRSGASLLTSKLSRSAASPSYYKESDAAVWATVEVNLTALTGDLLALHSDEDRLGLDLSPAGHVLGDPPALGRIFDNLVDNALRHASTVTVRNVSDGGKTCWSFEDDGPGVAPDQQLTLGTAYARFDPSRDRQTGGAGLGLAIVCGLAEAIGGSVSFRSKPGRGLHVQVVLLSAGRSSE